MVDPNPLKRTKQEIAEQRKLRTAIEPLPEDVEDYRHQSLVALYPRIGFKKRGVRQNSINSLSALDSRCPNRASSHACDSENMTEGCEGVDNGVPAASFICSLLPVRRRTVGGNHRDGFEPRVPSIRIAGLVCSTQPQVDPRQGVGYSGYRVIRSQVGPGFLHSQEEMIDIIFSRDDRTLPQPTIIPQ